jgi:uncharacterized protein
MRFLATMMAAALALTAVAASPAAAGDPSTDAMIEEAVALVETDPVAARALVERAAASGDPTALANLGAFMASGIGGPVDIDGAISLYERAVAAGSEAGALNLGRLLLRDDDPSNDARGLKLLGPLLDNEKLAGPVLYPIGRAMLLGLGGREPRMAAGLEMLALAESIEPNNPDLLYLLARGYQNGWGDWDRDPVKAADYFRRSAEAGDHRAEWQYGMALLEGDGLAADARQAWIWVRRSGEGGNVNGQVSTAVMLAVGQGVQENDAEARLWYRKAAEQGSAHALRGLGYMLVTGEGGPADIHTGIAYIELARDSGMENTAAMLDSLGVELDGAGRRRVDAIKADWKKTFGEPR